MRGQDRPTRRTRSAYVLHITAAVRADGEVYVTGRIDIDEFATRGPNPHY